MIVHGFSFIWVKLSSCQGAVGCVGDGGCEDGGEEEGEEEGGGEGWEMHLEGLEMGLEGFGLRVWFERCGSKGVVWRM